MDIPGGKVYQGSPKEIVVALSEEISTLFAEHGMPPTGVHVIALLHVVACAVRSALDDKAKGVSNQCGDMPSFKSMLAVLTHGLSGSEWTQQELRAFNDEFCGLIKSLGGSVLPKGAAPFEPAAFMAPMSKEVH